MGLQSHKEHVLINYVTSGVLVHVAEEMRSGQRQVLPRAMVLLPETLLICSDEIHIMSRTRGIMGRTDARCSALSSQVDLTCGLCTDAEPDHAIRSRTLLSSAKRSS